MAKTRKASKENAKRITPERAFFYGVGALVVGGAVYYTARQLLKNKEQITQSEENQSAAVKLLPHRTASQRHDRFPLQKGSKGERVIALQQALQKILGAEQLRMYTPIDGDFGSGTESALQKAGFPKVIEEQTYYQITSGNLPGMLPQTVQAPAAQLYEYAQRKNLQGVLSMLQSMQSVSDYSSVNEAYKKLTEQKTFVTKTIVTDLLEIAFKDNPNAREQLRKEFLRIGLKYNPSTDRWSLSGIAEDFHPYKDLKTLTETYVEYQGLKIPVAKNTILGEEQYSLNGMTYFKALDGKIYRSPSSKLIRLTT